MMKYQWLFVIILLSSILLGATGCFMTNEKEVGRGIKLSFVETPEKVLYEGQPFNFKLKVSNYGSSEVTGDLCLSDTPSDSYGGIPSNDCQPISLDPALQTDKEIKPAEQELFFPQSGSYMYSNIPSQLGSGLAMNTQIITSFSYSTKTIALVNMCTKSSNSVSAQCNNQEAITKIEQAEMPIELTSIEKTIFVTQDNIANIGLTIHMKKMEEGQIIDPQELSRTKSTFKPSIRFSISLPGASLKCTPVEHGDTVTFSTGDEKVVQCTGTKQLTQDLLVDPLVIILEYGFKKTANIGPIEIKKEVI